MGNRLRRKVVRSLDRRYEELRLRYWENRALAERLMHEPERFNGVVIACFAAALTALECALEDRVISQDEHVWLLQAYTAFDRLCVDDYSECAAGFEVELSHPLGTSARREEVEAYLTAARVARDDIKGRAWEMRAFYEWAVLAYDFDKGPYYVTTAAALRWTRFRHGLGRRAAVLLRCYFSIMHSVVEDCEFGVLAVATELDRALRKLAAEPEQGWTDGLSELG